MKKVFIALSTFILIALQMKAQVSSEEIAIDEDFIKLTIDINKFATSLSENFKKEELNSMVTQVTESDKKMSPDEQIEFITNELKLAEKNYFVSTYQSVTASLQNFHKKFGDKIDKETLTNASEIVLKAVDKGCGWRFALCAAAVGAEGVIMLGACEGGTIGIGTPACVALVVLWTANELDECRQNYCLPKD